MRVLVTGGAGFIGSHLVDLLVAEGHTVVVLDRRTPSSDTLPRSVTVLIGDIRDASTVTGAAEGADVVFHLAARTDLAGHSVSDYDVNTSGTECIAAASRRAGVRRLVFFSSMLAVGLTGRPDPIDESSTDPPQSLYGDSKRRGEEIVRRSHVPFTVIRPTLVYGPREQATMHAFLRAVYRRRFALIGPDVLQAFAYVRNVVRAAYDAATHPGAEGGTFFVSDERPYTLAQFACAAADALGCSVPRARIPLSVARAAGVVFDIGARIFGRELVLSSRRVRTMTTNYVYSIARARESFGFTPPYGLDAAMTETARWYLERKLL